MKRPTRDKAKKQHEFQFDSQVPWKTGPAGIQIGEYADFLNLSEMYEALAEDDEKIDALQKHNSDYSDW